jgi:hypothetical protein
MRRAAGGSRLNPRTHLQITILNGQRDLVSLTVKMIFACTLKKITLR